MSGAKQVVKSLLTNKGIPSLSRAPCKGGWVKSGKMKSIPIPAKRIALASAILSAGGSKECRLARRHRCAGVEHCSTNSLLHHTIRIPCYAPLKGKELEQYPLNVFLPISKASQFSDLCQKTFVYLLSSVDGSLLNFVQDVWPKTLRNMHIPDRQ